MSEFLLEIFSEEIPAAFQTLAQAQLANTFSLKLEKAGLSFDALKTFGTPRRLGLVITGLPAMQDDRIEERKGPAIDAPLSAIEGFLKSTQKKRSDCEEKYIGDKGPFLFVTLHQKGQPTLTLLGDIIKDVLENFQWPKSMRWKSNEFLWARPLHNILALFNGQLVPVYLKSLDLSSSPHTFGHRFLSPHLLEVKSYADYKMQLAENYVQINPLDRQETIKQQSLKLLAEKNLILEEDDSLLEETANLVEWPVVLRGEIDPRFMTLPEEVLITSMRVHQRYFATREKSGKLAPYFLIVSNMETADQGAQIIEGNERVLRARLSDAHFFWNQDVKRPLKDWAQPLKNRIFQEKLGTLHQKIERMEKTAAQLHAFFPDISLEDSQTGIRLMKADLSTGMVGEFPELQGIMGGHYARAQGIKEEIAQAIQQHYAPEGPQDLCPKEPLSVYLSLVDKLDTLVGFFGAGLIPTASKDPYALRRTALGIIRLILENNLLVSLDDLLKGALQAHEFSKEQKEKTLEVVKTFILDRLAVYLKTLYPTTFVTAVLEGPWEGSLTKLNEKLRALKNFFDSPEGPHFLNVYKRASNALKSSPLPQGKLKPDLFTPEEHALFKALKTTQATLDSVFAEKIPSYEKAIVALADLRPSLEVFFGNVMVQDPDESLRTNRLLLLTQIEDACLQICDLSKL